MAKEAKQCPQRSLPFKEREAGSDLRYIDAARCPNNLCKRHRIRIATNHVGIGEYVEPHRSFLSALIFSKLVEAVGLWDTVIAFTIWVPGLDMV
jgi:hypothetical protein